MNLTDIVILIVVVAFFILAILQIRKKETCSSGDCSSCSAHCHSRKNEPHKSLVERYYEDHPRSENSKR